MNREYARMLTDGRGFQDVTSKNYVRQDGIPLRFSAYGVGVGGTTGMLGVAWGVGRAITCPG